MKKIKAGIIGGAGYTGGEVLRLLLLHPAVQICFVHSRSNAGKAVSQLHQDLIGNTSLCFTDTVDSNIDVFRYTFDDPDELTSIRLISSERFELRSSD